MFLSQFPVAQFHALMEDKTAADAIMDRIIHASRVIELTGESMRKLKARDELNQDEEGGDQRQAMNHDQRKTKS
ncbi:MAG: ATP-binding protein [Ferrimicrobium sp.]